MDRGRCGGSPPGLGQDVDKGAVWRQRRRGLEEPRQKSQADLFPNVNENQEVELIGRNN